MAEEEKITGKNHFVEIIEQRIISGEMKTGEKIKTERELAQEFALSKTVINSGMAQLRQKGFIRVVPRHGAYVADYLRDGNIETLIEIISFNGGTVDAVTQKSFIEFRIINESAGAGLAAENRSSENLSALYGICDRIENAYSIEETLELAISFHREIFASTGNSIYPLLFKAFENITKTLTYMSIKNSEPNVFAPQMRRLTDAIAAKNRLEAKQIMEELILSNV